MSKLQSKQVIRLVVRSSVQDEVLAFLIDRQARGLSFNTVLFYRKELQWFGDFLGGVDVLDVSPDDLRRYLIKIGEYRNPGGCGCAYRAVRAFFNWYADEVELDDWRNPISKVKSPKVKQDNLDPVSVDVIKAMLDVCDRKRFNGQRDRCILLALLDTGCRASEFVGLNVNDLNLSSGALLVRDGKGGRSRSVFLGSKCRREMTRYLRCRRGQPGDALWVTGEGGRLTYFGLREIVRRLSARAGVECPPLHSFRRAFALACLRGGMDLVSLQRLMGHADLTVLRRYLNQTVDDLADAHQRCGPVDCLL